MSSARNKVDVSRIAPENARPDPLSLFENDCVLGLSEINLLTLPERFIPPLTGSEVDCFDDDDLSWQDWELQSVSPLQRLILKRGGQLFARRSERYFQSDRWKAAPSLFELAIREVELERHPGRDQAIKTLILGSYWRGLYITHGLTKLEREDPSLVKLTRVISDYPEVYSAIYGVKSRQSFGKRISGRVSSQNRCDSAVMLDYLCNYHGLTHSCEDLRTPDNQGLVRELNPDLIVVGTYGTILTEPIISVPRYGVVNFHPSNLPSYAGAQPFEDMLEKEDFATKVTAHFILDCGVDSGPIIGKSPEINIAATIPIDVNNRSLWLKACHHRTALVAREMARAVVGVIRDDPKKWKVGESTIAEFKFSREILDIISRPIDLGEYDRRYDSSDFAKSVVRTYEARSHPENDRAFEALAAQSDEF